jgi:hypothetical protein
MPLSIRQSISSFVRYLIPSLILVKATIVDPIARNGSDPVTTTRAVEFEFQLARLPGFYSLCCSTPPPQKHTINCGTPINHPSSSIRPLSLSTFAFIFASAHLRFVPENNLTSSAVSTLVTPLNRSLSPLVGLKST